MVNTLSSDLPSFCRDVGGRNYQAKVIDRVKYQSLWYSKCYDTVIYESFIMDDKVDNLVIWLNRTPAVTDTTNARFMAVWNICNAYKEIHMRDSTFLKAIGFSSTYERKIMKFIFHNITDISSNFFLIQNDNCKNWEKIGIAKSNIFFSAFFYKKYFNVFVYI